MATHRRMEERVPIESTSPLGAGTPASVTPFRIGVTGHRPPGLDGADLPLLRRQIRTCLELVRRELLQSAASPVGLIIVSPLAEGADRIVAEEGLLLGYALHALLPFPREHYLQDFLTAESRRAFERLLADATDVVELAVRRRQITRRDGRVRCRWTAARRRERLAAGRVGWAGGKWSRRYGASRARRGASAFAHNLAPSPSPTRGLPARRRSPDRRPHIPFSRFTVTAAQLPAGWSSRRTVNGLACAMLLSDESAGVSPREQPPEAAASVHVLPG